MKKLLFSLTIILVFFELSLAQCTGTVTLSSDVTIDVTNTSSYNTSFSSSTANSNELMIDEKVVIESGVTLTIKGTSSTQFNVLIRPGREFHVKKGGTLIIEYCDLGKGGTCAGHNYTTWDGIRVFGDAAKTHYAPYDLTNGWDPYAEPFKPWGTYRVDGTTGDPVHGRLQMRWCNVSGIEQQGNKGADDGSTSHIDEGKYGNYAIRSKNGGILDIIDTDFEEVRTAIYVENYDLVSNWRLPRAMNAFNIIDCDFEVESAQRTLTGSARFSRCIHLIEVQRVSIEGCTFTSKQDEDFNYERGVAFESDRSSFLMHKSGNFRREIDIKSTGETYKDCLLYGTEQSSLTGYPPSHPWLNGSNRKTKFSYFYRAIVFEGSDASPRSYIAIDDAEFNHNFYGIRMRKCFSGSITRSNFTLLEANDKHDDIDAVWTDIFGGGHGFTTGNFQGLGKYDRYDIMSRKGQNLIISENTFSSDYDGDAFFTGKTVHIIINSQLGGQFSDATPRYVYDLVYKNTFDPQVVNKDVGVWLADQDDRDDGYKSWTLFNCNDFEDLKTGVFIDLSGTQLIDQFHHFDMTTGRNAPTGNTYTNNNCNYDAHSGNGHPFDYYYANGGSAPADCSGNLNGVQAGVSETPGCASLDCTNFPMIDNSTGELAYRSGEMNIFPNPTNGSLNVVYNVQGEDLRFNIVSMDGKVVSTERLTTSVGMIERRVNLPAGIYFASIVSSTSMTTEKLVITD